MIVFFLLFLLIFSNSYSIDIEDSNINSTLEIVPEKGPFFLSK